MSFLLCPPLLRRFSAASRKHRSGLSPKFITSFPSYSSSSSSTSSSFSSSSSSSFPSGRDLNCRRHYLLHKNLLRFVPPSVRPLARVAPMTIQIRSTRDKYAWNESRAYSRVREKRRFMRGGCEEKFIGVLLFKSLSDSGRSRCPSLRARYKEQD